MVILAVDLGKARTGLAVCDKSGILASPAGVITEYNPEKLLEKVAEQARAYKAELLVMGLPRNMDGSEGESAQNARQFGAALSEKTGLPVEFQDERGTTITAHNYLNATNTRGKKRKAVVDAVAAVVILQNYLDRAGQCPEPIRGKTDSE
ncbi:MAG TPA: Holliday junction resolvase RuvX [Firmicutes bacterium]|nr:Holliday junction resolvase RuvX [Bacillota bacterium]